ncbi:cyclic pyranopterin monophosphate synthase subunit MoaA [Flavobacterium succinicans]|uniref:GTP 3',8-cyclase n=1 Tax=Flavobacterium succinicans TaxID=29536 RepID=A0A1I4TKC3_9FLAO|nr:GTP 3',8-cyclase MoaA [Flavobacterium succinicans]SFM77182.1 cyclic pyranopterin monophosphate synthase subunit MoaA [Flavobacterium succinicans]
MVNNSFLLQDTHQRNHSYLRISITEKCNLRCTYCMPAEGIALTPRPHLMTEDEIVAIAQTFVDLGVTKIRLTGGEPLVRKEAHSIIERLGQLGVQLTLTTNGLLVHDFIPTFKKAGINALNVSIDSLQKEKYKAITRRDSLDLLWKNIELLLQNDFQVKLNVVVIKGFNDNEILDFIALTKAQNLQIRFIEFMPFDGNQWNKEKLVSYAEIIEQVHSVYSETQLLRMQDQPNDTAKNYKIEGFKGSFSIISSVTNPFCSTCNRIRLTADGKLKNCLFSNSETALLPSLRAGEAIAPLIYKNIQSKHAMRGGMDDDAKFQNPDFFSQNRSMIKIGG